MSGKLYIAEIMGRQAMQIHILMKFAGTEFDFKAFIVEIPNFGDYSK
jgi:hypothetical protein